MLACEWKHVCYVARESEDCPYEENTHPPSSPGLDGGCKYIDMAKYVNFSHRLALGWTVGESTALYPYILFGCEWK